jgi:hypothetical protein
VRRRLRTPAAPIENVDILVFPGQAQLLARRSLHAAGRAYGKADAAQLGGDDGVGAEIVDRLQPGGNAAAVNRNGLRADADEAMRRKAREGRQAARLAGERCEIDDVHRRCADEAGGEHRRRPVVKFRRRAFLLHAPLAQQHHLVGHAHGLDLVVRYIDERDAEPALQRLDLQPHVVPQLGIEIGQRLVHQADRIFRNDGARECHALALAA